MGLRRRDMMFVWNALTSLCILYSGAAQLFAPNDVEPQKYPPLIDFTPGPAAHSAGSCLLVCIVRGACAGVFFDKDNGKCSRFFNSSLPLATKSQRRAAFFSSVLQLKNDYVSIGEWILAYRLVSGAGGPNHPQYMDDGLFHDPRTVPPECLTLDSNPSCSQHYKSKIITRWGQEEIELVKVVLIKDNVVQREIVFNGVATNKVTWFSRPRILSSSWTDLLPTTTFNYFAITGYSTFRRWYIHHSPFSTCANDRTWLLVVDYKKTGACTWDNPASIPQIYYSNLPTRSGSTDWERADVMAVLIKLKNN